MAVIKIKNFGPIDENVNRDGLLADDGLFTINISAVCVFVGYQSSGKSTLAKLYSIFTWIEKTLQRDFLPIELNTTIFKKLCTQQEIGEYFRDNTVIVYNGDSYSFKYDERMNIFTVRVINNKPHSLPKIQYISAVRNLLTILYNISADRIIDQKGNVIELSSNIPFMVKDLNAEYLKALERFGNSGFYLPVEETKVHYYNHNVFIKTKGKTIFMSSASSGIQSIAPLLMVSRYLSDEVQKSSFEKLKTISSSQKNSIEKKLSAEDNELAAKFQLYCIGGKDILEKDNDIDQLENHLNKYLPSHFINIVEEPEQNLFPETQADVLYELLACRNTNSNNKLVLSTHSPYILMAINNAILAHIVFMKTGKTLDALPQSKMIAEVSAYMLENGKIVSIIDNTTGLINAEKIDSCSTYINDVFDKLQDLGDE